MNSKKTSNTNTNTNHPIPMPIPKERKSLQQQQHHVAKHSSIPDAESAQDSATSSSAIATQPIPSQRTKEKVELDDVKVSNINIPMREKVAEQHAMSAQNVDTNGKAEHGISLDSNDAGETRNR